MFMQKRFVVLALLLVLVLVTLSACGTAAPAPEQAPAERRLKSLPLRNRLLRNLRKLAKSPATWRFFPGGPLVVKLRHWTLCSRPTMPLMPDVNIVNATVAGGGGSAARGVLQTRLAGGDPPDTWQVHPGFELIGQYVDPGFLAAYHRSI